MVVGTPIKNRHSFKNILIFITRKRIFIQNSLKPIILFQLVILNQVMHYKYLNVN